MQKLFKRDRSLSEKLNKGFNLGDVEVRPAERVIVSEGVAIRVEPKAMDVLVALAESGQDILSREQLITRVWPRGFVTDDVLNRCISNLRSALGDSPRAPRFIITVPRRGYHLAKTVEPVDTPGQEQAVLVLPLQNLSLADEDYIVDSLTELLISRLAVSLKQPVISRTTAMTFKDSRQDLTSISRKLGVRWVVEGSVMHMGEQVQVVIQLIDANTDTHSWAETWTRSSCDMLTVLNEISRLTVERIRSELQVSAPAPAREQPLATDLLRHYLQGVHLNSRRTHAALRQAVVCFERVLQRDPEHAPTLSGLAHSYVLLAHYGAIPAAEGFSKGRQYAEAALALAPRSQDALANLAAVEFFFEWEFDRAQRLVERALAIHPTNDIGLLMAANIALVHGRNEIAQSHIDKALEVDPLNTGLLMNAGDHLILQRRFGEAAIALTSALQINPLFRPACLRLALAYAFDSRMDDAVARMQEAREMGGEDAPYLEYLAIVGGMLGKSAEAQQAALRLDSLAAKEPGVSPWALARAWTWAGDQLRAIEYLQEAYKTRSSSIPFLGITPVFDPIREQTEVQDLMRRIGLS